MLSFILSLVLFLVTIPLRSLKYVVSMNISLLQKGKKHLTGKGGLGGNGVVSKSVRLSGKAIKAGGKAIKASGKTIKAGGKTVKVGGKTVKTGTKVGGTGVKLGGKAAQGIGKGISAIPVVGTVVGGAVQGVGKAAETTGEVTKKAGEYTEKATNAVGGAAQTAGGVVDSAGNAIENAGDAVENAGSNGGLSKTLKGLPLQAAIVSLKLLRRALTSLIIFISALSKITTFIGVLIIIVMIALITIILSSVGVLETCIFNGNIDWNKYSQSSQQSASKKNKDKEQGKADIEGWLKACKRCCETLIKDKVHYSKEERSQKTSYGKTRVDCTGYVWLCIVEFGGFKKQKQYYPWHSRNVWDDSVKKQVQKAGFEYIKPASTMSELKKQVKKGDIQVHPGHMVVYAGGDKYWEISCATTNKKATPNTKSTWLKNLLDSGSAIIRLKGSASNLTYGSVKGLVYPPKVKGMADIPIFYQSTSSDTSRAFYSKKRKKNYGKQQMPGYPGKYISGSGCSWTSASMIATYFTGKDINPIEFAYTMADGDINKKTRYYKQPDDGNRGQSLAEDMPKKCGFENKLKAFKQGSKTVHFLHFTKDKATVKNIQKWFDKGAVGYISALPPWAVGGHYLVIRGMVNGKVCVNDPNAGAYARPTLVNMSSNHMKNRTEYLEAKFDWDKEVRPYINRGLWLFVPK